ncbi:DegT/DnrJ/EryC1/StrS family aminotransferase [Microvirga lenta]|uniref:DegT/DnrJ/EryC1/StrS family aminotransferase n=1 Tax=Microvirga lenta TaxID=2881337 RepID=UPI001CFF72A1|nr:DegT/DnrJ/EryC1/StrS family aminotransferase [Microvirga lenta]MCB5176438.1 DegT/DnrJ/EryC1/StrS family aminotransferase [Microvirga lenta]
MAETNSLQTQVLVPVLPTLEMIRPYLESIDRTHIYSNDGPLNRLFCLELAKYLEGRITPPATIVATTVSNGTIAIELALKASAKRDARYIMLPAYTFIATAHAVKNAGFEPFFLDVDEELLTITPEIVRAALSECDAPAAVIVVSPFGGPVQTSGWEQFEDETGIPVIFDCAAAITSIRSVSRQPMCISLHATKMIGVGEGGAVISTDADLIARIRQAASFGFTPDSRISEVVGGNYRLSEYAAAIGLSSLESVDGKVSLLFDKARIYRENFSGNPVRFQPGFGQDWIAMTMNVILEGARVQRVLDTLDRHRLPWRRWWSLGCHTHPAFANSARTELPVTEVVAYNTIGLPFHVEISEQEIARISRIVTDA